jgi:hypothetical protein
VDIDHPAYPGLMLVMMSGELPFFVRRSNYDQDPYFVRCFSPDPSQKFIPIEDQPLLGHEYTPQHIWTIRLPDELSEVEYAASSRLRKHARFHRGEAFIDLISDKKERSDIPAPCSGTIVDVPDLQKRESAGDLMTIRAEIPVTPEKSKQWIDAMFGEQISSSARERQSKRLWEEIERRKRQAAADEEARARRQQAVQPNEKPKQASSVGQGFLVLAAGQACLFLAIPTSIELLFVPAIIGTFWGIALITRSNN